MKTFYTTILFLIFFGFLELSAQDYIKVDKAIDLYPKSYSSPEKLAEKICNDFQFPKERARAIYAWIAKKDLKQFHSKKFNKGFKYKNAEDKIKKIEKFDKKFIRRTLKNNKAVCYGYSLLFKEICGLCNIECHLVNGGIKTSEKQIGKRPNFKAHSWNVVYLDSSYYLVDVTWGAGKVDEKLSKFIPEYTDQYFFTDPELFFLNHFPKDKKWILTEKTIDDFMNQPLYYDYNSLKNKKILNPTNGIISIKQNDTIRFEIQDVTIGNSLLYSFSKEKYSYRIENSKIENNSCKFEIINRKEKDTFLTLYIDYKPIVTYKINID